MSCRWLGQQAEALGVEIYPGFAAAELLEEDGRIVGIATGDMGIGKDGQPTGNFQRGMELRAALHPVRRGLPRLAVQAADARASTCATAAIRRPTASASRSCGKSRPPITSPGLIEHTHRLAAGQSAPMAARSSTISATTWSPTASSSGWTTRNPWLSPFEEMQRFKTHPAMRRHFEGGRRISLWRAGAERGRAAVDPEARPSPAAR